MAAKRSFFQKTVFAALVLAELAVVAVLVERIHYGQTARSQAFVTPIAKESLVYSAESRLKYFYELRAGYGKDVFKPPWLPYQPEYHYNADGLNDRFDYAVEKPPGTFLIITLGDSWTYGQFVSTKDNYSEVLEDFLNNRRLCRSEKKFEVLNLGVPSYDIEYSAERFRLRGAKYRPDLVLWLLIRNDFEEINEFILPRAREYRDMLRAQGSMEIISRDREQRIWNPFSVPPADEELAIWGHAVEDQNRAYGGEEGVLRYQENVLHVMGGSYGHSLVIFAHSFFNLPEQYTALIRRFAAFRPGTYFYESSLAFEGDRVLADHHPSSLGHKLIARDLFDYLNAKRLIPCGWYLSKDRVNESR